MFGGVRVSGALKEVRMDSQVGRLQKAKYIVLELGKIRRRWEVVACLGWRRTSWWHLL